MSKWKLNKEVSLATVLTAIIMFAGLAGAWYSMPQKIMADCDSKYETKELAKERCVNINSRLDKMQSSIDVIYKLLLRMGR